MTVKRMNPEPHDELYNPEFFRSLRQMKHESAPVIAPMLISMFHPRSVVDVGCAIGEWLQAFAECGVQNYKGYDGEWVPRDQLLVPTSHFEAVDLSQTMPRATGFDLAICLEVAEHLPPKMSSALVECLTRSAPVVLFSAAIPGQIGTGHINARWPWYWDKLFLEQGYVQVDAMRPQIAYNERVAWYYRQNLVCYIAAKQLPSFSALAAFTAKFQGEWRLIPISERILRETVEEFKTYKAADLVKALGQKAQHRLKKTWRRYTTRQK